VSSGRRFFLQMFQSKVLHPSSGSKNKLSNLIQTGFLLGLFFYPEDRNETSVDYQQTTMLYTPIRQKYLQMTVVRTSNSNRPLF
jgi:hypothetical protein